MGSEAYEEAGVAMTDFDIVDVTEQQTAVVRTTVPMAQLREAFDHAFPAVFGAVGQQGVAFAGAPFGYYLKKPTDQGVEVEIGVPVSTPISPAGSVVASTLPGGKAVHGMHVGPYEKLEVTYEELMAWVQEQGLTLKEGMWECYLSDPSAEPDPATWRTEIFWPVED